MSTLKPLSLKCHNFPLRSEMSILQLLVPFVFHSHKQLILKLQEKLLLTAVGKKKKEIR